ncbi:MAG: YraN family protein [Verrucomicrobia bacterium]|nr:YraN family protein [Verrucomicrobiota bacterium]
MAKHLETGEWGEGHAERFLRGQGMKILGRRVRFGPREELDLVARDGEVLVFVEVKTRRAETFGRPMASVDRHKRAVLSRAAVHYLKKLRFRGLHFRFDVVEVIGTVEAESPVIRHIPNAFTLDPRYQLPF